MTTVTTKDYVPPNNHWCDTRLLCAVVKRYERRLYGESTLERGVVKHPPYPDLVTGWGV